MQIDKKGRRYPSDKDTRGLQCNNWPRCASVHVMTGLTMMLVCAAVCTLSLSVLAAAAAAAATATTATAAATVWADEQLEEEEGEAGERGLLLASRCDDSYFGDGESVPV